MGGDLIDRTERPEAWLQNLEKRVRSLETNEYPIASGFAGTAHADTHILGGSDEIDADQADIDWDPSSYSPGTAPPQVTNVDHLTAHLYGVDQLLGTHESEITTLQGEAGTANEAGTAFNFGGYHGYNIGFLEFENKELSNIADGGTGAPLGYSEGVIFYDRNVSSGDYPLKGTARGGWQGYNADDGWGLLIDTQNMDYVQAEFAKLKVSGGGDNSEIDTIRDEDDMASNDVNALATQQSIKAYVDDNVGGGGGLPTGAVVMYGGTSIPDGYLECDGSAVSRSTYSDLFNAIGTNFGSGDGSTTFNLPDMRGMFPRGHDATAGNDPDAGSRTANNSGGNTGDNVGSEQSDELASHRHGISDGAKKYYRDSTEVRVNGGTTRYSTSAGGNETRPKNVYFKFIIKT